MILKKNELCFFEAPLNVKLPNDRQNPRYLEKEGFYVGTKPFVTKKNRNLMEDRLIHMPEQVN